jgi:hypothetical protein
MVPELRRAGPLVVRSLAVIVAVALLLGTVGSFVRVAPSVLAPILGPGRIELSEAGFAVSLPRDWQYARATIYDEDWFDPASGAPIAQHERFLADGGVLLARKPAWTETGHEQCQFYGLSNEDAQDHVNAVDDDPRAVSVETVPLELPAGRAVAFDRLDKSGGGWRDYLVTDGERWILLVCGSPVAPADRWPSIAETIEFLPVEE